MLIFGKFGGKWMVQAFDDGTLSVEQMLMFDEAKLKSLKCESNKKIVPIKNKKEISDLEKKIRNMKIFIATNR